MSPNKQNDKEGCGLVYNDLVPVNKAKTLILVITASMQSPRRLRTKLLIVYSLQIVIKLISLGRAAQVT